MTYCTCAIAFFLFLVCKTLFSIKFSCFYQKFLMNNEESGRVAFPKGARPCRTKEIMKNYFSPSFSIRYWSFCGDMESRFAAALSRSVCANASRIIPASYCSKSCFRSTGPLARASQISDRPLCSGRTASGAGAVDAERNRSSRVCTEFSVMSGLSSILNAPSITLRSSRMFLCQR